MRAGRVPLTRFLERGRPYLLGEPVLNNLMLTVVDGRRDDSGRWWLATDGDTVVGAAMHAGPGLLLAGTTRAVAEAIADAVDDPVPQATGPTDLVGWFDDR
jgi:hypothetical protein